MIMSDARPRETAILTRGEYLKPREKVSFAPPAFLPPMPEGRAGQSPRACPLAGHARAPADRPRAGQPDVAARFFGTGIVKTSEDFGVQSEFPVHRELLDWLAVEFRERGWDMKAMHRLIVTSATYRQSSRVTPEHRARDLENRLYSRASRFRMPSLILRDWALASTGLIDRRIGGRPVYPYQPDGDLGGARHHQGTRLHVSGLLGQGPLSSQPLHLLAANGRAGQHVRRLEPADLPRAVRHDEHAAARPHHAQRPDLGRGRAGPGRAKHESVAATWMTGSRSPSDS